MKSLFTFRLSRRGGEQQHQQSKRTDKGATFTGDRTVSRNHKNNTSLELSPDLTPPLVVVASTDTGSCASSKGAPRLTQKRPSPSDDDSWNDIWAKAAGILANKNDTAPPQISVVLHLTQHMRSTIFNKELVDPEDLPDFLEGIDSLIAVVVKLAPKPAAFAAASSVLDLVERAIQLIEPSLMADGKEAAKTVEPRRSKWLEQFACLQKTLKKSKKLKNHSQASLAALQLRLSSVELLLISLPDVNKFGKTTMAVVKVSGGIIKSVLSMSLDKDLVSGAIAVGGCVVDQTRRGFARRCSLPLRVISSFPSMAPDGKDQVIESVLFLHEEYVLNSGSWLNPAKFAETLCAVVLLPRGSDLGQEDDGASLSDFCWNGGGEDPNFGGLESLLSFGDPAGEQSVNGFALDTSLWVQSLSTQSVPEWINHGLELASSHVQLTLSRLKEDLFSAGSFVDLDMEMLKTALVVGTPSECAAALRALATWENGVVSPVVEVMRGALPILDATIAHLSRAVRVVQAIGSTDPNSKEGAMVSLLRDVSVVQLGKILDQLLLPSASPPVPDEDFKQGIPEVGEFTSNVRQSVVALNSSTATLAILLKIAGPSKATIEKLTDFIKFVKVAALKLEKHAERIDFFIDTEGNHAERTGHADQLREARLGCQTIGGELRSCTENMARELDDEIRKHSDVFSAILEKSHFPCEALEGIQAASKVALHLNNLEGALQYLRSTTKKSLDSAELSLKVTVQLRERSVESIASIGKRSKVQRRSRFIYAREVEEATLSSGEEENFLTEEDTQRLQEQLTDVNDVDEALDNLAFLLVGARPPDLPGLSSGVDSDVLNSLVSGAKEALDSATAELKVAAFQEMEGLASTFNNEGAAGMLEAFEDVGGADMLSSLGGVMGDAMNHFDSRRGVWRVRDVAVLAAQRLAASENVGGDLKGRIRQALARRSAFESNSCIRERILNMRDEDSQVINSALSHSKPEEESKIDPADYIQRDVHLGLHNLQQQITDLKQLVQSNLNEPSESTSSKEAWLDEESDIAAEVETRLGALGVKQAAASEEADPMKKMKMICECRKEHAALRQTAKNIGDVSKKLDVVIDFLGGMQDQLASIDSKLSVIQQDVTGMREDLRRLLGESVVKVYDVWAQSELEKETSTLQDGVYVKPMVCGPGSKNDFTPDPVENPEEYITESFMMFMTDSEKQFLLLTGGAGSGKSTATKKLQLSLLGEYAAMRFEKDQVKVIVLPISLPALQNPLGDLFDEGAKLAYGGQLRQSQVDELRTLLQTKGSKHEVVFVLDAFDELSHAAVSKNLYRTNNLEQFRASDASSVCYPKIIVSCRSELFSNSPNYEKRFWPSDTINTSKDAGRSLFQELRLTDFTAVQREDFMRQHVAIELRDKFAAKFPTLGSTPRSRPTKVVSRDPFLLELLNLSTVTMAEIKESDDGSSFKDDLARWNWKLSGGGSGPPFSSVNPLQSAWELLAAVAGLHADQAEDVDAVSQLTKDDVWTEVRYQSEFSKIKELEELTTTPFMLKIITEILPLLSSKERSTRMVKTSLVLSLDEHVAEVLWAHLGRATIKGGGESLPMLSKENMAKLQQSLDEGPSDKNYHTFHAAISKVATDAIAQLGPSSDPSNLAERPPGEVAAASQLKNNEIVSELSRELVRALRRTPTRRAAIYDTFVESYIGRETRKLQGQHGASSADQIQFEATALSQELALHLVAADRTKLRQLTTSALFKKALTKVDVFFSDETLARSARAAAPISMNDASLSFIHKTVMEHSVAVAVVDGIARAFDDLGYSPPSLFKLLFNCAQDNGTELSPELRGSEHDASTDEGTGPTRLAAVVPPPVEKPSRRQSELHVFVDQVTQSRSGEAACFGAAATPTAAEARRHRNEFGTFADALLRSPLATQALDLEPAIRDFLTDKLLDDPQLAFQLIGLVALAAQSLRSDENGGLKADDESRRQGLALVVENSLALVSGTLPRRKNSTLIHEAARAGNQHVVQFALEVMMLTKQISSDYDCGGSQVQEFVTDRAHVSKASSKLENFWSEEKDRLGGEINGDIFALDVVDDDGKTALYFAAEFGDEQIISLLMRCGADPGIRPKLEPRVVRLKGGGAKEPADFVRGTSGRVVTGEYDYFGDNQFLVGVPTAAVTGPSRGLYVFEVEVVNFQCPLKDPHLLSQDKTPDTVLVVGLLADTTQGLDAVSHLGETGRTFFPGDGMSAGEIVLFRPSGCDRWEEGRVSGHGLNNSSAFKILPRKGGDTVESQQEDLRRPSPDDFVRVDDKSVGFNLSTSIKLGAVFTIVLDLDTKSVSCAVNGEWRPPQDVKELCGGGSVFPAISAEIFSAEVAAEFVINCGKHPFKHAPRNGHVGFSAATGDYATLAATRAGHGAAYGALQDWTVSHGHIDIKDNTNGRSLLHFLAAIGESSAVQSLLQAGAECLVSDSKGVTPARDAAKNGHVVVLALLRNAGADLNQADNNGHTPAFAAAHNGHVAVVELLKDAGADLKHPGNNGDTPGHAAAHNGHVAVLEILRHAGVDLNQANNKGNAPGYSAALNGHVAALELLRDSGVDLKQANKAGVTLGYAAALNGHVAALALLRDAGADLKQANKAGVTLGYAAAYNGHAAILELLRDSGVDLKQATHKNNGKTLVNIAAENGHVPALEFLRVAGVDLNQANKDGDVPGYSAAGNGHVVVLALLRDAGADLCQANKNGNSPALAAARNGHWEVLELLRDAGVSLNQANNNGVTPALVAAQKGHLTALEILRDAGADLNQASNDGSTPALVAAQKGDVVVLALLRDAGADLNQASNDGSTPALVAAQKGDVVVLALLRDAGADLNQAHKAGHTPTSVAAQNGHAAALALLRGAGADLNQASNDAAMLGDATALNEQVNIGADLKQATSAFVAAQNGDVRALELLHEAGADLNQPGDDGVTPAIVAALIGQVVVLEFLRDAGADLNQPDNDGDTPAIVAAHEGRVAILEVLRDAEADLHQANNDGDTPANIAAQNGHVVVLALLRDAGADLHQANNAGATPASSASENGHTDVLRFLSGAAAGGATAPGADGDGQIAPTKSAASAGEGLGAGFHSVVEAKGGGPALE